jgi:hypothetical protein
MSSGKGENAEEENLKIGANVIKHFTAVSYNFS